MLRSADRGFTFSDVLDIARFLGVPLTDLLGDFAPLPSLDWYFTARNPALARRAPDSVERRTAATLWLERHFAQLYRLDHPPLYFMQAFRRSVQFKAVWQLPVGDNPQRLLYVADAPQAVVSYFFENEIQPGSDIGQADAPWPADIRDWRTEDELEDYLQAAGYCVQLYPKRLHVEARCGPDARERATGVSGGNAPAAGTSWQGTGTGCAADEFTCSSAGSRPSKGTGADQGVPYQTNAAWRPPDKGGKMKELTWSELIAIEPRLEALRAEVAAVDDSDVHFCANRVWYQHFKPRLKDLVGWECDRGELGSQQAWDVAHDAIYGELPPCRDCACL